MEINYLQKLRACIERLVTIFTKRHIYFSLDEERTPQNVLYFNEVSSIEDFEQLVKLDLLPKMLMVIDHDIKFYDPGRLKEIVSHIIDRLKFDKIDPFEELIFNDRVSHLDAYNKELVDSFLEMQNDCRDYCIALLTETYSVSNADILKTKIIWRGTQIQLAELFARLLEKGWIETPTNTSAFADLLNLVFDLSKTSKKADSDRKENLRQHLKPLKRKGKIIYPVCKRSNSVFSEFPDINS